METFNVQNLRLKSTARVRGNAMDEANRNQYASRHRRRRQHRDLSRLLGRACLHLNSIICYFHLRKEGQVGVGSRLSFYGRVRVTSSHNTHSDATDAAA